LRPRYKLLAHNDTGSAVGHQAGVLIPKGIESYFPPLNPSGSAASPTSSVIIQADLIVGGKNVGHVETRYQHQTWAGSRRAERRITGNLGQLLGTAAANDLLVFERDDIDQLSYRLTLHPAGSPGYLSLLPKLGSSRWGKL
jgi:putative restriction endonuclease